MEDSNNNKDKEIIDLIVQVESVPGEFERLCKRSPEHAKAYAGAAMSLFARRLGRASKIIEKEEKLKETGNTN